MLELDPSTGKPIDDVLSMLTIVISNALATPYESRVFNPKLGTSAVSLLQEPVNDAVIMAHTQNLLISAIHRAIPEVTVKLTTKVISSGKGTAELRIYLTIKFNGTTYDKEYSSYKRGFVN
jgi:phage baseplate assembly protein W